MPKSGSTDNPNHSGSRLCLNRFLKTLRLKKPRAFHDADLQAAHSVNNNLLPTCIFADEWTLKTQITNTKDVVIYELILVNDDGNMALLPENAALDLPYPEGMTADNAASRAFTVVHKTSAGTEVYTTQEGTLKRTPYGIELIIPPIRQLNRN